MPEKTDFFGIPWEWAHVLIYVVVVGCFLVMLYRLYLQVRLWWTVGRPERRWDQPFKRLWRVVRFIFAQSKVMGQLYPGIMHVAIFWSFLVFFAGTAAAVINTRIYQFLVGSPYLYFKMVLDLFVPVFLIGVLLAEYRRWVQKPKRLTFKDRFSWSLILIALIVVTGLTVESIRLAIQRPAWAAWSPVAHPVAQFWTFTGLSEATLYSIYYVFYTIHPLLVCLFFVLLPSTPLFHVLTTPFNVFFSKLDRPVGQLAPIPQDAQGVPLYARSLCDLTWSQLLNGDGCTECGRCQDACPAHAAGQPLNPKEIMLGLRNALHSDGAIVDKKEGKVPELIGKPGLTEEILWSCTSCGACVQECPVLNEHVDTIVDMRRYLVSEGRLDSKAQDALKSLGRYGNSFGQSERARVKWAQTLEPKIKDARKGPVEYLWFVGDYASYNPALTETTQRTAKVFQKAGIDFGILYEAERNAGNDVRRVGEEGLFEMLVEKNGVVLRKCDFKAIVTTDPHSYNTLKHEYPADVINGRPVLHYTELLDQMIVSGKLTFSKRLGYKVTYQDPCYLGRYNRVYDAPRRVIEATGCEIIEMPRNGKRALCCGAGGGRIWMEEKDIKERPSESRIREAVGLDGIQFFVVACPKDTTMYRDAVKTTGQEQKLAVKDLIELVNEAL